MPNHAPASLLVPEWPYACATLVEVAHAHAARTPAQPAYTFVDYATERACESTLTHESLDRRARQIGALLQMHGSPGARVLLLYPGGLDYVAAFFGCLYAGMVAVPAYPPLNARLHTRLGAVAQDCHARIALTDAPTLAQMGDLTRLCHPLARMQWFATDGALDGLEHAWRKTAIDRKQLAFLQYTSGSSGTPKGVTVTHGNLMANVRAIAEQGQYVPQDRFFSWLPPYHDMGLIGAILSPFCAGMPAAFMTPLTFVRRPSRWLREISTRRCTISGAPNFAYELCIEKVSDSEIEELDLSSWQVAFCGAEPIKLATLERFAERFAACGFDRRSLYPCYGMAETTLMVTGKQRRDTFKARIIDKEAYARDQLAIVASAEDHAADRAQAIVCCGAAVPGHSVAIVDPVTLAPLPEDAVGEILVAGPSVAAGYWQRETETLASFRVRIEGHEGDFLRTGDLGFLHGGEVHVSGRLKDLIIVHGVNHYPQDIEDTVNQCHEAIRPDCGICFSIEHEGEERLVVVQEVGRRDKENGPQIIQAIRDAIANRHDIHPHAVALVERGSINKTTSGKLSRRPCREDFLGNELKVVTQWTSAVVARGNGAVATF